MDARTVYDDSKMPGHIGISNTIFPNAEDAVIQISEGDGMRFAGIYDDDYLVIKKYTDGIEAQNVDIVIAIVNEKLVCRRYFQKDGQTFFRRENGLDKDVYPSLNIKPCK